MQLEQMVQEHERRLKGHEQDIKEIQNDIKVNFAKLDANNMYLREENQRQSAQNERILQAIVGRNSDSDKRNHELKKLNQDNLWKLIFLVSGASGLLTFVLNKIFGG